MQTILIYASTERRVGEAMIIAPCACTVSHRLVLFGLASPGPRGGRRLLLWPRNAVRAVPEEVPHEIAILFKEAGEVAALSPRGGAALARVGLEAMLKRHPGVKPPPYGTDTKIRNPPILANSIQGATRLVPAEFVEQLHHLRDAGNFGAHYMVDGTGDPIDVAPELITYALEVIEQRFQHLYVLPKRREEAQAKLAAMKAEQKSGEKALKDKS